MLKIYIVDNGQGIKRQNIDRLFSMFGKLRRTAAINSEGIGMGLEICSKLVEMNSGKIQVHSDGENMGSIFSFTMKM